MKSKRPKNMNAIREAVCKHHGGFEDAPDEVILRHWRTLSASQQREYLASVAPAPKAGKPEEK